MNIKELRKQAGMTQAAFSALLGIPARTLQNWEKGVRSCPEYIHAWIEKDVREYMERTKPVGPDELRKMPAAPVWVDSEHVKGWHFIHGIRNDVLLLIDRAGRVVDFPLADSGKTWSAYWRKPE